MERSTESVPPDDSSSHILAAWPAGRIVADRYQIGEVLGVGGSSVIYRAHDRALQQDVALKVLRPDRISPAAIGRLRREVAVARNASSPHLVRVFDIGEAGTDTFITMELVAGESLRRRLERGPLPIGETLSIAKEILRGLSVLHAQKIVHRDIKPSNVLIDPTGAAKLADFGLAVDPADDTDRPTQTGTLVGTAEYMSPEQVTGAPLDARSDLYSFGVLLYECLTGQLPFGSRSSVAALLAHVRERPKSVRELRPEVPPWLSRLTDRLLAKNPEQRFGSAVGVLKLIEEERAPRNWRPAAAIATGVVLLTAVLIAGLRLWPSSGPFDRIAAMSDGHGIQALDSRGRVLWTNPALDLRYSAVVRVNGVTRIAAIEHGFTARSPRERSTIVLFDPDNGGVDSKVTLTNPAPLIWPSFADVFSVLRFLKTDLDHDGNDEVVVAYAHEYWPSYVVVYDLAQRNPRATFVNSGHAPNITTADVNGDGRDDLLVAGINNRMGWYNSLAAVDAPPIEIAGRDMLLVAGSPDALHPNFDQRRLLWYVLLRPQYLPPDPIAVDPATRTITLRYTRGPSASLSYGGFLHGTTSRLDLASRSAARDSAYDALREVNRLLDAGQRAKAAGEADTAVNLATDAGDPFLAEWARRNRMRTLIRLGRTADAQSTAEKLLEEDASAGPDVCWDIAREMHLTGDFDGAFRWYRRGIIAGRETNAGRNRYEFVEGAVLALVEQKRWREGEIFLDEARRILPSFVEEPLYINYIRWRRGDTDFVPQNVGVGDPDLARYWDLEQQHARGLRATALLARVKAAENKRSSFGMLLASLESVALAESGDMAGARRVAAEALEASELLAKSDPVIAAHLDIVRERAKELGTK